MEFRLHKTILAICMLFPLVGCGLLYDIGQQDALRACEREMTQTERAACRQKFSKTYEQYESDRQAIREAGGRSRDESKVNSLCFRRASATELVCPN